MNADSGSPRKDSVDIIFTVVIILFFATILVGSFSLSRTAGSVPRLISVIGIILSVISLLTKPKQKSGTRHYQDSEFKVQGGLAFIPTLGLVLGYFLGMIILGFIVSTFMMLVFLPVLLGYRKYRVNILFSLITTAILYVSFGHFFHVRLPVGIIFEFFR